MSASGRVQVVGVEGTNSYGAGITRALQKAGFEVREVLRPARRIRRMRGKSDPVDAIAAARTVLSGDGASTAKDTTSPAESLRYLYTARKQLVRAATALIVCIKSLLITAPDPIRAKYDGLANPELARRLSATHPSPDLTDPATAAVYSLKHLARTWIDNQRRADQIEDQMHPIVETYYPRLLDMYGAGTISAAQLAITAGGNPDRIRNEAEFASLCGVAPIPASSGKTNRYRINHGGDRRGNNALHAIAMARMRHPDARTTDYINRHLEAGKTKKDIRRLLKRAIAREVYRALTHPDEPSTQITGTELRNQRINQNITMTQAAHALHTWPARISDIEKSRRPLPQLKNTYQQWLQTTCSRDHR